MHGELKSHAVQQFMIASSYAHVNSSLDLLNHLETCMEHCFVLQCSHGIPIFLAFASPSITALSVCSQNALFMSERLSFLVSSFLPSCQFHLVSVRMASAVA